MLSPWRFLSRRKPQAFSRNRYGRGQARKRRPLTSFAS
jgi:hypothetical protein